MTARRLLGWSDLEERRRRAQRGGLGALPPLAWSALAAAGLAAELARRIDAGAAGSASQLWIAVAIVGFAVVVFMAPFRMFWRHDSALLARMPLRGGVLYRLALMRSARAALRVAVPCAVGACAFGVLLDWEIALRHLALAGAAAFSAALLGPAAALLAGALIASDRALALIGSIAGGEIGAPKTTWLGLLPGLTATAIGAALLAGAPWVAGLPGTAIGPPAALLGAALGVSIVALAASLLRADGAMVAAVREVAALDTVRLAHVERSTPSSLERAWAGLTLGGPAALVFDKDARLARRRYPAPYFVCALGVAAAWVVAAAEPVSYLTWTGALLGGLAVYAVIMARRLTAPPIEHAAYLATLAVAPSSVRTAKRSAAMLRLLTTLVLAGVPLAARAPDPAATGIAVGVAIALAAVAALQASRLPS